VIFAILIAAFFSWIAVIYAKKGDCPKPPINPTTGKTAIALYDFKADPNNPETMSITVGMEFLNVEVLQYGWTKGTSATTNKRGTFPSSYVKIID